MSGYLALISNGPGRPRLVLFDADDVTASDRYAIESQSWGNPVWTHDYSGERGTQGARPAGGSLENRTVRLAVRIYGDDHRDLATRQSEIGSIMGQMRRYGGRIERRAHDQVLRQFMRVLTTPGPELPEWDRMADVRAMVTVGLSFVCEPMAEGDPMAWEQTFTTTADLLALTPEAGGGPVSIAGGERLNVGDGTPTVLLDSLRRYAYGDVRLQAKVVPDESSSDQRWGLMLRWVDANNWLAVMAWNTGGLGYLRVVQKVAGIESTLATTATVSGSIHLGSDHFWLTGWIEGNVVFGEFLAPGDPSPYGESATPQVATATLGTSAAALFGVGTTGRVGALIDPATGSAVSGIVELRCQPYYYAGRTTPVIGNIPLNGPIPGDATATASIAVTTPAANAAAARWALIGWAERLSGRNRCWNGDLENGTTGWATTAVTGITAAATALASYTIARYGAGSLTTTLSTTALSGVNFRMWDRFRKGVTYTARMWVRDASGYAVTLCLGVNGDLATASNTAADGGWYQLTVSWTPTADRQDAYVALRTAGGTVRSPTIDAVEVVEAHQAVSADSQTQGIGAYGPLCVVPAVAHEQETGTTDTADAATLVGTREAASVSGAGSCALSYMVDPNLTAYDDYTLGELDVEVWARVKMDDDIVGLRGAVWANPPAAAYNADTLGARRAAQPGGIAGRPIVVPATIDAWRIIRLGVVPLAIDPDRPGPWRITVSFTWQSGSTDSFDLDYVAFVPARSRVLSPTGEAYALGGYPDFIGTHADEVTKIVRSDLSAVMQAPPARALYPDHGLGGSTLLELPAGEVDLLVILSDLVPDDPDRTDSTESGAISSAIAVSPIPRWEQMRDV